MLELVILYGVFGFIFACAMMIITSNSSVKFYSHKTEDGNSIISKHIRYDILKDKMKRH